MLQYRQIPEAAGSSEMSELNLDNNAVAAIPAALASAQRLKVLRLENVCEIFSALHLLLNGYFNYASCSSFINSSCSSFIISPE